MCTDTRTPFAATRAFALYHRSCQRDASVMAPETPCPSGGRCISNSLKEHPWCSTVDRVQLARKVRDARLRHTCVTKQKLADMAHVDVALLDSVESRSFTDADERGIRRLCDALHLKIPSIS
jgi:hypothetical protein